MILEGVYDMIFSFAEVDAKLYYRIMKQIYSKYIWNIEKKKNETILVIKALKPSQNVKIVSSYTD